MAGAHRDARPLSVPVSVCLANRRLETCKRKSKWWEISIAVGKIEILHMINEQNGKNIKSSYEINDNEMIKQILVLWLWLYGTDTHASAMPLSFNNSNNPHNDKTSVYHGELCKICTFCYGFDEEWYATNNCCQQFFPRSTKPTINGQWGAEEAAAAWNNQTIQINSIEAIKSVIQPFCCFAFCSK